MMRGIPQRRAAGSYINMQWSLQELELHNPSSDVCKHLRPEQGSCANAWIRLDRVGCPWSPICASAAAGTPGPRRAAGILSTASIPAQPLAPRLQSVAGGAPVPETRGVTWGLLQSGHRMTVTPQGQQGVGRMVYIPFGHGAGAVAGVTGRVVTWSDLAADWRVDRE